jgi:hypothetical protein
MGSNDFDRELELPAEGEGLLQFAAGQAGGIGNRRQRFITEDLPGDKRQENGIDPAGIGNQAGAVAQQTLSE